MKTGKRKPNRGRSEWPAVVYVWAFSLEMVSYAVARLAFDRRPHPYHWLAALLGGVAGIPIGWLWFRWRGDVF
jgi:hypothetical protein